MQELAYYTCKSKSHFERGGDRIIDYFQSCLLFGECSDLNQNEVSKEKNELNRIV